MNAHADVQFGMAFQRLRNFHCAQDWRFRTVAKDERAAVSCRQTKQFAFRFRDSELFRPFSFWSDSLCSLINPLEYPTMSMKRTCPISSAISFFVSAAIQEVI
jgi:hypothetical protein